MKFQRALDLEFMRRAGELARRGLGHTRPNPAVGAVIARGDAILGEGYHHRCGAAHAEVMALRDARRRGNTNLKGATLYVTLEPCSKAGRVGACTDAIMASGITRVLWACPDPNPTNRGKAARLLRRANIATACWWNERDAEHRNMAREIERTVLRPFTKHITTGLPFVTVKLALSLDGRICDDWGRSQWISSADALKVTGRLRECVDVVMVGGETVRKDNPSLRCHTRRNDDLHRAIVTRSGKLPRNAQVLTDDAAARTHVYRDAVEAIRDLGKRGFLHVLCEGGLELARSLAAAGLVDEWINVCAPIVIGHQPLNKAVVFAPPACAAVGRDTLLTFGRHTARRPE